MFTEHSLESSPHIHKIYFHFVSIDYIQNMDRALSPWARFAKCMEHWSGSGARNRHRNFNSNRLLFERCRLLSIADFLFFNFQFISIQPWVPEVYCKRWIQYPCISLFNVRALSEEGFVQPRESRMGCTLLYYWFPYPNLPVFNSKPQIKQSES